MGLTLLSEQESTVMRTALPSQRTPPMTVVDATLHGKLLDATQWTKDEDLLGGLQLNVHPNFCETFCPQRTLTTKCHLKPWTQSMDPVLIGSKLTSFVNVFSREWDRLAGCFD